MEKIFITNSPEETIAQGEKIARESRIFALFGELGSGKTTFVQGIAHGLGIKKRIISPTFVFVRQYKVLPPRRNTFYHVDLYRIENEKEIGELGLEEILEDPQNIIAIEWAEKIEKLLPGKRINVYFEYLDENKRRITVHG